MHSDEFLKAAGQDERLLEWAGRLTLKEGLFSLAERVFSKLLHLRGKPEDFAGLSTALIRQKRFAEAEELLLQSLLKISAPSYLLFCVYPDFRILKKKLSDIGGLRDPWVTTFRPLV